MVRPEYKNSRDLTFSKWHRTLGRNFYAMNLDWIEYHFINNILTIVGLIEDKDERANVSYWMENKAPVLLQISEKLNVPAYLVLHNCNQETELNPEIWRFNIVNLKTNNKETVNKDGYKNFLVNLRRH